MSKPVIEISPKAVFGYCLFFIGLLLLGYVALNCILLANGTMEPLKVSEERIGYGNEILFGIFLQIGAFAVLVGVSYLLMKMGLQISKR